MKCAVATKQGSCQQIYAKQSTFRARAQQGFIDETGDKKNR